VPPHNDTYEAGCNEDNSLPHASIVSLLVVRGDFSDNPR
jgi:hypothetical protein